MKVIKNFLTLPFRKSDLELQQMKSGRDFLYNIEGYIYNPSLHALALHAGIDRYVDYGTEVYSPIDGYAMASYNFSRCYDFIDGKPSGNIRSLHDKKLSYGLGYSIQLYCPTNDIFLLFGHLSYLSSLVGYVPPKHTKDDFGNDMRSCSGFALNKELKENIDNIPRTKKISKGDYLGDVGLSGLYVGREFPDEGDVNEAPRKQIKITEDMYTEPHLHMNLFTRDDEGKKNTPIDPYDIYSTSDEYPIHGKEGGSIGENHIFIENRNGLPIFVDEYFL